MNCTCNNCDWTGPESALACDFEHIPDLVDRIDAGGEVPAGECPECGALAYLVKDEAPAPSPRVVIIVAGGVVADVLCSDAATRVELLDHDNAETKAERDTLCLREAEAEAELHSVPIH